MCAAGKLDILVVEDDVVSGMILENMLLKTTLTISAIIKSETLESTVNILESRDIDMILLDLNLPDSNGLDTLISVKEKSPQKPVVVITGEHDEILGLKAISNGAQEYLLKGKFDVDSLAKSIRYGIERKGSEERARKNERMFQTLISHLPQSVLMKDKDLVFVCCNEKHSSKLGLTPDQLIGKKDEDFYTEEIVAKFTATDQEVIRTGRALEEFSRYQKSGREIITRVLKTPVKNDKGNVEGVLCVFEDFTERIHSEENLRAANRELEETNRQLKEMQCQLVQNEKLASIGQLAAGVAHEMNTPIGFIAGNFDALQSHVNKIVTLFNEYLSLTTMVESGTREDRLAQQEKIAQLYEKGKLDFVLSDIQPLFDESKEGLQRVTDIVQNLRDFSRIDQLENMEKYDLNKGIEATLVMAANKIKYDADVETELSQLPAVSCHANQINQVILNILVNAAQAIGSRGREDRGTIRIKTYTDADHIICEIADDGPGISPENRSKIFDPFFTTKPVGEGTGLGLSISHDIITEKHKGQLLVDSTVGKGTLFTIKLPIVLNEDSVKEVSSNESENSVICR
ncbi:MAG: PAS domain-containing protein [Planctomycetes bacterium]|nr:PAS domain-containing protein [Planctomycetota bacterium]